MAELAVVATVATAAAAVIGAGATIYNGYMSQQAAKDQAHQVEVAGRADFAATQRDAQEKRLEGQLVLSKQQAAAAASGGGAGADAPTIVRLMTETADRSDYSVASTMYGGYSRRANSYASASNIRQSGFNNFIGSLLGGAGELVGGVGDTYNMADKFNLIPA